MIKNIQMKSRRNNKVNRINDTDEAMGGYV